MDAEQTRQFLQFWINVCSVVMIIISGFGFAMLIMSFLKLERGINDDNRKS